MRRNFERIDEHMAGKLAPLMEVKVLSGERPLDLAKLAYVHAQTLRVLAKKKRKKKKREYFYVEPSKSKIF